MKEMALKPPSWIKQLSDISLLTESSTLQKWEDQGRNNYPLKTVSQTPPRKKIHLNRSTEPVTKDSCYFCDGTSASLCAVSTYQVNNCVRKSALALQDGKLLAKLNAGDMMAQDAKYHPLCLASIYKRAKSLDDPKQDDSDKINHWWEWIVLCDY